MLKNNIMEDIYVIKDLETKEKDKYVAIDQTSGGYPYLRDLINAHKFYSKEKAIDYMNIFKDEKWIVQKLIYNVVDI